jgi:hypothetical protein
MIFVSRSVPQPNMARAGSVVLSPHHAMLLAQVPQTSVTLPLATINTHGCAAAETAALSSFSACHTTRVMILAPLATADSNGPRTAEHAV